MRRYIFVVLLACLPGVQAVAATAAESSPAPEVADRIISLRDAGVAITFPATWRVWPSSEEITRGFSATNAANGQHCQVSWFGGRTAKESAARYSEDAEPDAYVEVIGSTVRQETPVGEGFHAAWRFNVDGQPPTRVQHEYFVPAAGGVLSLRCSGDEVPADRFLGIIEAITPLPADLPPLAPFDPRVEIPHRRVALSLPQEWSVLFWEETMILGVPATFGDVIVLQGSVFDPNRDGEPRCRIEEGHDFRAYMTADDWRVALAELVAQGRTASVSVIEEVLPAGPAIRIEIEPDSPSFEGDMGIAWLVPDGDRLVSLYCFNGAPPADRWRSIAETLELLP